MISSLIRRLRRNSPNLREKFLREAEEFLEQELARGPTWPSRSLSGRQVPLIQSTRRPAGFS